MYSPINARTDCQIVGKYVDEAEIPTNITFHQGEAVRPSVVSNYVDLWAWDGDQMEPTPQLHR